MSSSTGGLKEENRLEKWETKEPPISALLDNQSPSLVLRKLIAFDLLLIKVEE